MWDLLQICSHPHTASGLTMIILVFESQQVLNIVSGTLNSFYIHVTIKLKWTILHIHKKIIN